MSVVDGPLGVTGVECVFETVTNGSSSSLDDGEGMSSKNNVVPSRTLKLKAAPNVVLNEEAFTKAFESFGHPFAIEYPQSDDGCAFISFSDLRVAAAAREARDLDGHDVKIDFASNPSARDLDEAGRIVVRVEEHLGGNELSHIFSTYGDVRNIQDVPNVNIHKVVEFFDIRAAERATEALNAVDTDAMHAASVAYLEKTRCKLFLIPPRLPDAAGFPRNAISASMTIPKTLPLGGATKTVIREVEPEAEPTSVHHPKTDSERAMSRFFDSSSSLTSTAEQSTTHSAALLTSSTVSDQRGSAFGDQSSNDSSAELSMKKVLPTGLGLYDEDETEPASTAYPLCPFDNSAAYEILSANRGSGWSPMLNNGSLPAECAPLPDNSFDGFSPLPRSFMEQITGSPTFSSQNPYFMTEQQRRDATVLTHYLERLEEEARFQQAVRLEVMKRLNALKSFGYTRKDGSSFSMTRLPNADGWKTSNKTHHRKKGSRFPRRGSAIDLEQDSERRVQQEKMFAMDLERVRSGKDKRTTLMIKNIPNKYTQRMLLTRIEQEFKGTFDFFYLPIDFKNKCNVGYGFINMTSTDHIVSFVEHVHEQKWDKFNSDKVCCVTYARIQGRHALINHFQNSSLMLEDSKHQPLLFGSRGESEPFPIKAANI